MAEKTKMSQLYPEIQRLLEKQRAAFFMEVRERMGGTFPSVQELLDHERRYLTKIEEALKRLEEKRLEICESCQGEIGYRRLKARPISTLCIECQKRLEEAEKEIPPVDDLNREGFLTGSFLGRGSRR
jgi:DnaK suppressor protein